jgi:hypothetical protein
MFILSSSAVRLLPLCALLMAYATATAQDAPASAEGKVTVNGKPLAQGRIFFHVGKGQFVGCIVKDGNYKVERLPVGKLPVTVEFPGALPQYLDEKKSGLFFEAAAGSATYDIDLKFNK